MPALWKEDRGEYGKGMAQAREGTVPALRPAWMVDAALHPGEERMMVKCNGDGHFSTPDPSELSVRHFSCRRCGEMKKTFCPRKRMCAVCCWHTRAEAA